MSSALSLALKLSDDIESFPLGRCGPSDDPDMQYAYSRSFYDLAIRFKSAVKRIGDPELNESINSIKIESPGYIAESHQLKADLMTVIDQLSELSSDPSYAANAFSRAEFLNPGVIVELSSVTNPNYDLKKLVLVCEELNDAYARGNYITSAILIRTVLNHIPPIFGCKTFNDVVAQSGRSVKAILGRLNDEARPIADLHAHIQIRNIETLPTINQIEPFKAAFEVLVQEIIVKTSNNEA